MMLVTTWDRAPLAHWGLPFLARTFLLRIGRPPPWTQCPGLVDRSTTVHRLLRATFQQQLYEGLDVVQDIGGTVGQGQHRKLLAKYYSKRKGRCKPSHGTRNQDNPLALFDMILTIDN